ncbi:MAG TPA: hypothetical protein VFJ68_03385 [Casimicrobiaceae bacterium]|nr:hypothetical protein [Casimicrobiaceae bacterium]
MTSALTALNEAGAPVAASAAERMERALRLYRKRIARCRTPNQVNRVHIALANYMTPAEARYFRSALAANPADYADSADSADRQWIVDLADLMPTDAVRPCEFERRGLSTSVTHYTADVSSRERKTLIIGFTGNFHRLMLPSAWLLDCLNPALYDVLVLRDFARCSYAAGIRGLGDEFCSALANLATRIDAGAYRNVVSLGTSSGALPAILAAILLRLGRAVAIGAQDLPRVAALLKARGLSDETYATLLASRPQPFPEVLIVCGADYAVDVAAATSLQQRLPARVLRVRGCAEHAVLGWQQQQRMLPAFLTKILGQNLEEPPAAHTTLATTWVVGSNSASSLRSTVARTADDPKSDPTRNP